MSAVVFVAALVALGSAACGATQEVHIWSKPALPSELVTESSDGTAASLVDALLAEDCARMVALSTPLMESLRQESVTVFHAPERDDSGAREMRSFLRRPVQRATPVVEIGEHGFRFPRWWTDGYAYCLVEEGDLETAKSVYLFALFDGFDADLTWRVGLVSYWAGHSELALRILRAWPPDVDVPLGYQTVLDLMQREADVPESIQVRSGSVD